MTVPDYQIRKQFATVLADDISCFIRKIELQVDEENVDDSINFLLDIKNYTLNRLNDYQEQFECIEECEDDE